MEANVDGASSDATSLGEAMLAQPQQYVEYEGVTGEQDETEDLSGDNEPLKEQDRFLPIANVARIMKKSIPKSGKIAKDAKECVQECVSEFISFITSEASERCQQEKRKTINGEDILFAMSTLGFDSYLEPLKVYLQKYRESRGFDRSGGTPAEGAIMEDLSQDEAFSGLAAGILTTDGQQNVIYQPTFQTQISNPSLNFG
ncbi:hypothetical protein CAPTEDRAFT_159684 [Capitella teleta]|uniref:Nuclear transcription factor Y subunit beta n=1 Tax=Capitella teleta TaxID=283909 RepID=R7U630_CAPTE|nr:hypothetical protein CAPTEDRAFT_159684 [Capitella teleta]|eukprot:ELU01414.1 hypothetical protein CAPTEDRAFT_159684 [Capitella teleta]